MPPIKHDDHTLGTHGYTEQWSPFGDQAAADPDPPVVRRHYGKFRGTVTNNEDPYFQGRLMVSVPGIVIANWATPCVPLTDVSMGVFVRPRIGANIWVEFERGDPDKPIWVGCSWGIGGVPTMAKASAAVPPTNAVISIETASSGVTICDIPIAGANVLIRSPTSTIMMNPAGIQINAPSVTITTGHFGVTAPNFTVA